MTARKITGCCTLCDEPMFAVKTTWPAGHPSSGNPRHLGAALDEAVRLTFVLSDGTTADMTFCEACAPEAEDHLPEIWNKALAAFAHEEEHQMAIGVKQMSDPVKELAHKIARRDTLLRVVDSIPLGGVGRVRWKDLQDG